MKKTIIPKTRAGAIYARLREMFGPDAQIQESYIRVEKELTPQSIAENFLLTGGSSPRRPLENFIGKNDLEVLYALKVCLNKTTDVLNGNNGNSVDYSYPDLSVFNAPEAAPLQSEANCLEAVYSGTISLKSDTFEALNKQTLKKWRVAPRTQFEIGDTQASSGANDKGYVDLIEPNIFSGQSTIEMNFEPAAGADVSQIGGEDGTKNILVFEYLTFVVRNGAQAIDKNNFDDAIRALVLKGRIK